MKIAISGASGFVGTHLSEMFKGLGYEIVPLDKKIFETDLEELLCEAISGCDVVINLAGAPINHRWSRRYKQQMYDSRIGVSQKIVSVINSLEVKPALLISASAVGYYPAEGCFDEYNSKAGNGFLSRLCVEWEREVQKVSTEVRVVNARFGVILAAKGGAFGQMVKPAKWRVATIIGSGKQSFSWIDLEDHGRAIELIIHNPQLQGIVNLVAPQQINNRDFTKVVAKCFHSAITVRIPAFFFKLIMGDSSEFITEGQCVKPTKLLQAGFVFKSDTIERFLETKIEGK